MQTSENGPAKITESADTCMLCRMMQVICLDVRSIAKALLKCRTWGAGPNSCRTEVASYQCTGQKGAGQAGFAEVSCSLAACTEAQVRGPFDYLAVTVRLHMTGYEAQYLYYNIRWQIWSYFKILENTFQLVQRASNCLCMYG